MAVILITHDLTVVRPFSGYVYVMPHCEVKDIIPQRTLPMRR
jgi:ABC-type microcin C transport system duplicated ATPase subunit YejF